MLGTIIAYVFLMLLLGAYCVFGCVGLYAFGLQEVIPLTCATTIAGVAFFFTLLKSNGYLLNFREYDMLMALPFSSKDVATCKFLYMYLKSLPWYLVISVSMMIGYGVISAASPLMYPWWLLLSLMLPIIPMLIASFFGFLIAKISAGREKKQTIQIILTLIFVFFCFSFQYIIEALLKGRSREEITGTGFEISTAVRTYYFPAGWFSDAVTKLEEAPLMALVEGVLFLGVSALLFVGILTFVGKYYRQINSALKSHATKRNFRMSKQKHRSVINAIVFKEYRRLVSSTNYFVNVAMGQVMAVVGSIAIGIVGIDRAIDVVLKDAPVPHEIVYPLIPLIVYFFIGMMPSTACSPSLEGKNFWILQSLPIKKKTIYRGKIRFQLYLSIPFMVLAVLCMSLSARVGVVNTLLYLIMGIFLCVASTLFGCRCGIRHMRLDWDNEVEVIKQGAAIRSYLLPNMLVTVGLFALAIWLQQIVGGVCTTVILIVIAGLLTLGSYGSVRRLVKE